MVVKYDITGLRQGDHATLIVSKCELEFLHNALEVLWSEYTGIMSKADEEKVCEMIDAFKL